ncbi:cell division protein FtsN [Paenibacillus albidus]|uniref:Cell division protein FtsN n=1 Tax=Paenibacillus albidus TaxID=2041023 RepID=A0A917FDM8_9BACL|nr:TasA family protein [Paenibacillus albidus]GGF65304.1 cell division protein FtsN [Paenibacillus albidus]
MNIKKTLGLGMVSAALGLTLIGGGTFAYFSDTASSNAVFNNGTLSLTSDPSVIVDLSNLKPGDLITREFKLKNDGSLDITKVMLKTLSEVTDVKSDNGSNNLKDYLVVTFLVNNDKQQPEVLIKSLSELEKESPDLVARGLIGTLLGGEKSGLKAGTADKLTVQFAFVENFQPQNHFQGDKLKLSWTFQASQGAGVYK